MEEISFVWLSDPEHIACLLVRYSICLLKYSHIWMHFHLSFASLKLHVLHIMYIFDKLLMVEFSPLSVHGYNFLLQYTVFYYYFHYNSLVAYYALKN